MRTFSVLTVDLRMTVITEATSQRKSLGDITELHLLYLDASSPSPEHDWINGLPAVPTWKRRRRNEPWPHPRKSKSDRRHKQRQKPGLIVENIKILLDFKKENGGHTFNWRRIRGEKVGMTVTWLKTVPSE